MSDEQQQEKPAKKPSTRARKKKPDPIEDVSNVIEKTAKFMTDVLPSVSRMMK